MKKAIFILLSILGISATFMPWVYIPRADTSIYGYVGDGLITAFLFTVALTVFLFQKNQFNFSKSVKYTLFGTYSLLAFLSFNKIYKFNYDRNDYDEINFMVSTALAGTKIGVGVYVVALTSIALFIFTFVFSLGNTEKTFFASPSFKIVSSLLIGILIIWALILRPFSIKNNSYEVTMENEFREMQLAFQLNDFERFAQYIHPVMIKPLGKENYKSAIRGAKTFLDSKNISIKAVILDSILHTEKKFNNIQSIISNRVVFATPRGDSSTAQRTLCISEDGGSQWYYFNTTGQSFQDVKNAFPSIDQNLSKYISK